MITPLVHAIALYAALSVIVALVLSATIAWRAASRRGSARVLADLRSSRRFLPPITVAMTTTEGEDLVESIYFLLAMKRPTMEILVVVDAGKVSSGMALLNHNFDFRRDARAPRTEIPTLPIRGIYASTLHPHLFLLDKEDGGLSDALNAAANVGLHPLFAHVPAGMRLHADTMEKMAAEFALAGDSVAAVAAPIRVEGLPWTVARLELATSCPFIVAAGTTPSFVVYRKRMLELASGFGGSRLPRIDATFRLCERLRRWGIDNSVRALPDTAGWLERTSIFGRTARAHAALMDALLRYGPTILRSGSWSARLSVLYLALFEAAAPLIEAFAAVALPAFVIAGWLDPASFGAIALMLVGAPLFRAGTAALVESDRLTVDTDDAVRSFAAVLLSPFLIHPAFILARAASLVLLARRPTRIITSAPPRYAHVPAVTTVRTAPPSPARPASTPPPLTWAAPPLIHPSETRTGGDAVHIEAPAEEQDPS